MIWGIPMLTSGPKEPAMYDLKAIVYSAAVGDALGVPFEF